MEPTNHQKQQAAYVLNEMVSGTKDIILTGGSGTGKTTTSAHIKNQLHEINTLTGSAITLTCSATTNEAANALGSALQSHSATIYKLLSLFPQGGRLNCHHSGKTYSESHYQALLEARLNSDFIPTKYVLIDEYSYVSKELLFWIMLLLPQTGVIYVGDVDQLLSPAIKGTRSPVEELNPTIFTLEENLRAIPLEDGTNPINDLSERFREAIHTGEIPKVDLAENIHLIEDEDKFLELIQETRGDYRTIAYTNKRVNELSGIAHPVGTVHKAQGSTSDTVFMDLKDMCKCIHTSGISTFNRLMYVGISRARKNLYIYYED